MKYLETLSVGAESSASLWDVEFYSDYYSKEEILNDKVRVDSDFVK